MSLLSPLTIAVHTADTSAIIPADSLGAAYPELERLLDLLRREGRDAWGTIRSPRGVLIVCATTAGELWTDPHMTPEKLAEAVR